MRPEAQRERREGCPPASRIGTATGAPGSGSEPLYQSGPVYLTGPYNGGPFGLSVVVPANAGPYHLGNIVVRASIRINPTTAQVSVVSNPLPHSIDGVPLRVKTVNVTVGRTEQLHVQRDELHAVEPSRDDTSAQGARRPCPAPFQAALHRHEVPPRCSRPPPRPGTTKADGAAWT